MRQAVDATVGRYDKITYDVAIAILDAWSVTRTTPLP
jgi:hypothetical protein